MRRPLVGRSIVYVMTSAAVFACATAIYDQTINLNTIDRSFPQTHLAYWSWTMGLVAPFLAAIAAGTIADTIGRKAAISTSVAMLSVSLVGIGAMLAWIGSASDSENPGIAEMVLLVAFHCTFIVAVNAMLASTMIYMFEWAPGSMRGQYVCIAVAIQGVGSAIGVAIAGYFSACTQCMNSIGWAGELLVAGAIVAPFAALAWNADEPKKREENSAPLKRVALPGLLLMLLVNFAGIATISVSHQVKFGQIYFESFTSSLLGSLALAALSVVSGIASDRYGRKPAMLVPGFLIALVPACALAMSALDGFAIFAFALGTLAFAFLRPAAFVALIEVLPRQVRVRSYLSLAALADAALVYDQGYKPRDLLIGDLIDWEIIIVIGVCAIAVFPNVARKQRMAPARRAP